MYKREFTLKLIFILLPVVWLCVAGLRLWHFAHLETQPPVFDALSYVQKAQGFWDAVKRGRLFNPFTIEPNIRPFGVVFFTYPFGFHGGFQSFYFLTVFLPLLIIYAAIWNVFRPLKERSVGQSIAFFVAVLAATAIPAAFQLEYVNGVNIMGAWGFVDLIFGSISALGISFIARSRFEPSINNAIWSSTIAILAVFVKPAGITIMAVSLGATAAVTLWQYINREVEKRYVLKVLSVYAGWYLVCALMLHHSAYFSRENIAYGESSLRLLHETQKANGLSIFEVLSKIWVTYGFGVLLLVIIGGVRSFNPRYWCLALLAACCVGGGLWLWIGRTNVDLVRYFFPFLLMAFIFVLPALLYKPIRPMGLYPLVCAIILPNIIIATFLFHPKVSPSVQKFMGINLSVNLNGEIVMAAESLRESIKKNPQSYIIYYCGETQGIQAFESVLDWSRILGFSGGNTVPALPIDWVHEPSYRFNVLLRADYIVFQPNADFKNYLRTHTRADDFSSEEWLIRSWLSSLTSKDGVERVFSGSVVLLHVTNPVALAKSAYSLVAGRQWRNVFIEGFSSYRTAVWEENGEIAGRNLLKEPIDLYYREKIVAKIRGFTHETVEGQDSFKLYITQLEKLPGLENAYWSVFVHEIAKDGKDNGVYVSYLNGVSGENETVVYHLSMKATKEADGQEKYAIGIFAPLPDGHVLSLINPGADQRGQRTLVSEK